MASINKINVNNTTYTLRDSRIPDTNGSTTQYLRGDGTWATPTVSTISSAADVTDNDTYMTIEPSSITPTPTVNLQTKTGITPTTSSQTITPDSGYDGLASVGIDAIPSQYIIPSGNLAITANATGIDVSAYATASVAVPTTFVTGTFTTESSAGNGTVTIDYSGSGYPIMVVVVVDGGAYESGTDWYTSLQRYAIGQWTMTKSVFSSTPTYTTSGTANQGVTTWIYKNSTSSSTTYSRSSAMNTNVYSSSNASNAGATCVRLKSNTSLSYYVNTSSYGLHPGMTYRYFIQYSE